ncbi:MAG: N-formylglutamate amidohydrolase [Gammaproteobacteria bacterium]|nr:N-formylglutamate amidohydrolase [Gammaproteobacteria bacterium]
MSTKQFHGDADYGEVVNVVMPSSRPSIVIVCEHASNRIPEQLCNLGLDEAARLSHAAWDPGAFGVASVMRDQLSAVLVGSGVSRLVYDCNRPPEALSAIPTKSEIYDIPGNVDLTAVARQARIDRVYRPFESALSNVIHGHRDTLRLMVTVHSFTPVYYGAQRDVEIGVLHGEDPKFAELMMQAIPASNVFDVRLNEPYSAQDGVAHTLDLHGARNDLANVMIEIRNDLIQTPETQSVMGNYLCDWISQAIGSDSEDRA